MGHNSGTRSSQCWLVTANVQDAVSSRNSRVDARSECKTPVNFFVDTFYIIEYGTLALPDFRAIHNVMDCPAYCLVLHHRCFVSAMMLDI
jgi:hypothetical protein